MEFIQGREGDFKRVNAFYREVVAYLEEHINYPEWSDSHPSEEDITNALRLGTQYICTDDGAVIGAVILSEDPEGDYEKGEWTRDLLQGEFLVIHVLATHPAHMQTGVGKALVKGCTDVARAKGYKAVRLDVVPDNHPAVRLYRACGFTYAGTKDLNRPGVDIPLFDLYELNL